MTNWVVGVDVGGTFTDLSARNISTSATHIHKRPSTPDDPSRAILEGLQELFDKAGIDPEDVERIAHGTTVATNALLQRKGARVGMVTTKGFRDLMEIGRQVRPSIYDLQIDAPAALAEREHRLEVEERIDAGGQIITPLCERSRADVVEKIRQMPELESVAVCGVFSFLNPIHENKIASAISEARPDVFISVSNEVQPEFREYERFSTTLINAFLQPEVSRYMRRLRESIASLAPNAKLGIFQSSGGLMNVDKAAKFPVRTALSGPAAGAVGASAAASLSDIGNVITLDMGGTSTDVCLIRGGKTAIAHMRDIAGFRIRLPMVDIHTVGAGGGSIAYIGNDNLLKVGPQSAGAVPGPACYCKGGTQATVSDANLVLGRLPMSLAGGDFKLDRAKAVAAVQQIADALDISIERAALGITEIVTSNMTRAIRAVSIEKGHDPRAFTLMPFGGAGGLHAAEVARSLGMARIIIPHAPGILCAEGLIVSDLQEDFVATCRTTLYGDLAPVNRTLCELNNQAEAWFSEDAQGTDGHRRVLTLDMRYVGQNYELPVQVHDDEGTPQILSIEELKGKFLAEHQRSYGHHDPDAPIEIVNLRLKAIARLPGETAVPKRPTGTAEPIGHENAWFDDSGPVRTPIYDRSSLPEETHFQGPAIITQLDATTVLPPWASLTVDEALNLILEIDNV